MTLNPRHLEHQLIRISWETNSISKHSTEMHWVLLWHIMTYRHTWPDEVCTWRHADMIGHAGLHPSGNFASMRQWNIMRQQQHGSNEQRHGGALRNTLVHVFFVCWGTSFLSDGPTEAVVAVVLFCFEVVCHPNGMMQQVPQMMWPGLAACPSHQPRRSMSPDNDQISVAKKSTISKRQSFSEKRQTE